MVRYEDYNPWLNGDASYLNGMHQNDVFAITIDTTYSYVEVVICSDTFTLQGDEADDFIKAIAWRSTHLFPHKTFSENVLDCACLYF